jgi:hypothetical protein
MKSFKYFLPAAILFLLLSACGTSPSASGQNALPFVLITSAPNSTATPTPFQPSLYTPTLPSLYSVDTNSGQLILPTGTLSPTPIVALSPTATPGLNQLFPTQAAPPVQANLVEPTALPPLTDNETINFLLIGSDKRPGSSYRTDTMVIAIVWPKEGQV